MIDLAAAGACREEDAVYGGADRLCVEVAGLGSSVDEICGKMGIAQATFLQLEEEVLRTRAE